MADLDPAYQTRLRALYGWREGLAKANTGYAGETPPVTQTTPGTPATPESYGFTVFIDVAPSAIATVHFAGYTTPESADADRSAWGSGVTVTSGYNFTGNMISFSNGRSAPLDNSEPFSQGMSLAGYSATAAKSISHIPANPGTTPVTTTVSPSVPAHFTAVPTDLDWVDNVVRILSDCLAKVYTVAPAVAKWDTLFTDAQTDCEVLRTVDIGVVGTSARYLDRYKTTCDAILVEAGIVPKSDASSTLAAASGCWQDDPSKAYWWVDESGTYLPAFTNQPYYSSRKDADGNTVSTQEFGFVIGCGCENLLKVGDRFTVSVNAAAAGGDTVRRVGDTLELDIVGASALRLRGGSDGNDTQTWAVHGSVSGALPAYALPFSGGASYTAAGVTARINQGGIPYALGDQFTLAVEAAQVQWRKGDAAWSAPVDLPASGASLPLVDGLSAVFTPGAPPSFVTGDIYRFALDQPAAPSHAALPDAEVWRWTGPDATLTASFSAAQPVQTLAAVLRDLPDAAQVFAQVSPDGITWLAEQAMPRHDHLAVLTLAETLAVQSVRLRLSGADGAAVAWFWAGVPRTTEYAATVSLRRQWATTQGDALNPSSLYAGSGMGGSVSWDVLSDADLRALLEMLDDTQQHGYPILFLPHVLHPTDAALVRVDASAIDLVDEFAWQPDQAAQRLLKLTLPLQAVYQ